MVVYAETPELSRVIGKYIRISTETVDYTIDDDDSMVAIDASSRPVTVNLLSVVGRLGRELDIKKIDPSANSVTVDAFGSETIDGGLTAVLTDEDESITLVAFESGWRIK